MMDFVLILALQVAAPEAAQQAPATQTEAAQPEQPKMVCTMEPVTGTLTKKQKVCKTPGFDKNAEKSQDSLRRMQNSGGNMQPRPPGGG